MASGEPYGILLLPPDIGDHAAFLRGDAGTWSTQVTNNYQKLGTNQHSTNGARLVSPCRTATTATSTAASPTVVRSATTAAPSIRPTWPQHTKNNTIDCTQNLQTSGTQRQQRHSSCVQCMRAHSKSNPTGPGERGDKDCDDQRATDAEEENGGVGGDIYTERGLCEEGHDRANGRGAGEMGRWHGHERRCTPIMHAHHAP